MAPKYKIKPVPRKPTLPKPPPNKPTAAPGPRGAILQSRMPNWETWTIYKHDPVSDTYLVNMGTPLDPVSGIPRLVNDPGEVSALAEGTVVVGHWELGYPAIAAVLKQKASSATEVSQARVTEVAGVGGEDPVCKMPETYPDNRAPNNPIDVLPDDWLRKSQSNNYVGVLAGGTNAVFSAPLAQVRTHGTDPMVEILAHEYRHISSMGNFEIKNEGGKTSLVWRAGADQTTENGANAENWTLRLDAGGSPEADLFRLRITTPQNNMLCEMHMSANGRLSLYGVGGVDVTSGSRGTYRIDVSENKEETVAGSSTTTIAKDVLETFRANQETYVSANKRVAAGNDLEEIVGHDRNAAISNKMTTVVSGSPTASPGTVSVLLEATNGGIETVTGNPIKGGSPSVQPAQNFINYSGNFNFATQLPSQKFQVLTSGPDTITLGADGAATYTPTGHTVTPVVNPFSSGHAAKFEQLEKVIREMMKWMNTHTHLSAVGPTSPGAAGAAGPTEPTLEPLIPLVKSTKVVIGG